ncbi:MAG: YheT family hydrolase [Stellaceae bacterium]
MDEERQNRLAALSFAPFRSRAPWWGSDLQTLRNYFGRRAVLGTYGAQRLILPLEDGTGDRLSAALSTPAADRGRPLVVVIHGLSGDERSHYMLRTAATLLPLGYPVLRLNLRGAGPSRLLSRFQYHAGRTGDFERALAALPPELLTNGVVGVGYSLGGNMLLKYLGERGARVPLRAAVSVSAPIDLAATSRRLDTWRNAPYQAYLMREMRVEALGPASELSSAERRAVMRARSIHEFDAGFSVPRNNFTSIDSYYDECSARHYLDGIGVPTLVIHAHNDPWVPFAPYGAYRWLDNPNLLPQLAPGGGHVGFHGRAHRTPWHDLAIAQFFDLLLSPP